MRLELSPKEVNAIVRKYLVDKGLKLCGKSGPPPGMLTIYVEILADVVIDTKDLTQFMSD